VQNCAWRRWRMNCYTVLRLRMPRWTRMFETSRRGVEALEFFAFFLFSPWNSECWRSYLMTYVCLSIVGILQLVLSLMGWDLSPFGIVITVWPILPASNDRWWWWWWLWSNRWNANWHGKTKYSEKTFPILTLSNTNPTWFDPDSNPGRLCRKLFTRG
jgi:hypothetical protein